ncbi:MAG: glycosyltransferase family 4 protein [Prevotellaceae bacterium]|jgi:glycosyltransferase involved in cell wall biosynthesis|nr:glycosyltransferase family 4 protein [Prevotellaceae bacterium]
MKILFIVPGSGDSFYCGNCFRDNLQASALRSAGHDVIIMPLYLPLTHPSFQADTPLFFPATTYYVAQRFFGKKMPAWVERITGSKAMLSFASSLSGTTSAEGMESMTLSMITSEDPAFAKHIAPVLDWIKNTEKPDVIHLSSTLLIGIAKVLKHELPEMSIVCSLQDEEIWIDSLRESHATLAWQGIANNTAYIDRFVTTSRFYQKIAQERVPQMLDIDVVYPGIDVGKYASEVYPEHPTIGFFYRMNHANGLDILAEAFVSLKKKGSIPHLKLKIGGGCTGIDKRFLKRVKKCLSPFQADVEINDRYDLDEHANFYASISVIAVPIRFDESVGLYLCESFAAGRPAVEPDTGSFSEIVGHAGLLYQPNDSTSLAIALERLLTDAEVYTRLKDEALSLSQTRYNRHVTAEQLETIYRKAMERPHARK